MYGLTRGAFLRTALTSLAVGLDARSEEVETIKFGGIQLPTNAPAFIAMEKGYFAKRGIKVELTWFSASSLVFSAVVSRDIDVGVTSATAATYNLAARGGFKIIGGTTRDAPGFPLNAYLVSNKAFDAGFTGFGNMSGRRFAITTAGSSHHYDVGQLTKKHGLSMANVVLVALENYGNISAALQTGQVDAAILPPALAQRLLDSKSAHFLAWSGDEVPKQQGIACTSPQTLARRKSAMRRFMEAYQEGAKEYHAIFNEAGVAGTPQRGPGYQEVVEITARYAGIKPAEVESQIAYIIADMQPDKADIMAQIAFWQDQGMVAKNADFSALFDLSLLAGGPA